MSNENMEYEASQINIEEFEKIQEELDMYYYNGYEDIPLYIVKGIDEEPYWFEY